MMIRDVEEIIDEEEMEVKNERKDIRRKNLKKGKEKN